MASLIIKSREQNELCVCVSAKKSLRGKQFKVTARGRAQSPVAAVEASQIAGHVRVLELDERAETRRAREMVTDSGETGHEMEPETRFGCIKEHRRSVTIIMRLNNLGESQAVLLENYSTMANILV